MSIEVLRVCSLDESYSAFIKESGLLQLENTAYKSGG